MTDKRPVNLNLMTIRFPIPAIASILHRISGVILFLVIPIILWLFQKSLSSLYGFYHIVQLLKDPYCRFIIWGILTALAYHSVAGVRHIFMDLGYGESLSGGRMAAFGVIIISTIISLLIGYWLW